MHLLPRVRAVRLVVDVSYWKYVAVYRHALGVGRRPRIRQSYESVAVKVTSTRSACLVVD